MKYRKIYILMTQYPGFDAKILRLRTRFPYTHTSVGLEEDMDTFYTFVGKGYLVESITRYEKPGRPSFPCALYEIIVTDEVYEKVNSQIRETSASRTRTEDNLNQYLFLDYMNYKGLVINEKISNKHFSVSVASPESLRNFLQNPTRNLVCINDVHLSEKRYEALRGAILDAFESVFPAKSRFEL